MRNKGITLIALVVTIIVLLLLAGISIQMITGDNGLLTKTATAKQVTEEATELELIKLAVTAAQTAGEGKLIEENLNNELRANFSDDDIDTNLKSISDYWNYKGYKIDNNGNVEKLLLPIEYQQVEYIESTGSQWIDTKYNFNGGTAELEIKFSMSMVDPSLWTAYFTSGSRRETTPRNYFCGIGVINAGQTTYLRATCGGTLIDNGLIIDDTPTIKEINDIKLLINENEKELILMNNGKNTKLLYSNTAINSSNFSLFGCSQESRTIQSSSTIYRVHITDNGKEIRKFIPCYSTTTVTDVDVKQCLKDTMGLYDTVEGKFYTNQGTGIFLKGNDV